MKDVHKLKRLRSQLAIAMGEREALKIKVSNVQREYNTKANEVKTIEREIAAAEKPEVLRVSEHALLRYLERVKGINIAELEKEILSESVVKLVEQLGGSGTYPNEGFSVVIKNFNVVTVET